MVEFQVQRNEGGHIVGLFCFGHAGFDEGGLDLVCAGVSALTGQLGIAFTEVLSVPHHLEVADGLFKLQLEADAVSESTEVLLRSTSLALAQLAQYYPGFIRQRLGNEQAYE